MKKTLIAFVAVLTTLGSAAKAEIVAGDFLQKLDGSANCLVTQANLKKGVYRVLCKDTNSSDEDGSEVALVRGRKALASTSEILIEHSGGQSTVLLDKLTQDIASHDDIATDNRDRDDSEIDIL